VLEILSQHLEIRKSVIMTQRSFPNLQTFENLRVKIILKAKVLVTPGLSASRDPSLAIIFSRAFFKSFHWKSRNFKKVKGS